MSDRSDDRLSFRPIDAIKHVQQVLRRHGFLGSLRRAAQLVASVFYVRETHVWYELALSGDRPSGDLPAELNLLRAGEDELELLKQLPTISPEKGHERLAAGVGFWFVVEGRRPVFACWTFYDRVPTLAARDGQLELPSGWAFLEDSVTSSAYRGRGIGPKGISAAADSLAKHGHTTMLTKVGEENVPAQRLVEKAGFVRFATVRFSRIGPRSHVQVSPLESGPATRLVEDLAR